MTTPTPSPSTAGARPWWPWLLTAAAFPPAGYVGHAIAGPVDGPAAAVIGGAVTGLGLGLVQWAVLRRRGVSTRWIGATAAGMAAGLAAGAALVSYRTDRPALALMGAISGLAVGMAQGLSAGTVRRSVAWALATAVVWAIGWTVTASAGIDVESQYAVFGASGALVAAFLQTVRIDALVPGAATVVATP